MHKNSVLLCTYSTDLYKRKYFFISLSYHFIIRYLVFCVGALDVEAEDRSVFPSALPASPTEIPVTPSSEHDPDNTSYIANDSDSVLNATESTDSSDNGGGQSIESSDNEKTDQSQELSFNIEKDGAIKSEGKNPNRNQNDEGEEIHPNGDQYDTGKGIDLNVDQYDTDEEIDENVDQYDKDEGVDLNEHKILLADKDLDAATEDMQTKGQ